MTRKAGILAANAVAYLILAGSLALADVWLTGYLLQHDANAFEVNPRVDASGISAMLGGAATSLTLFTALFVASFAACMSNERQREFLQISSPLDEVLVRLPGAASIWYLLMLIGAAINNTGMILFEYSWMNRAFVLFGMTTVEEQRAAFPLFTLFSFVVLIVPSYFIFSKIVRYAGRALPENGRPTPS